MKKSDTEQEQPGLEENKVPDSQSKRELDRELQELAEKEHQEEIYYEERRRERHERNLKRKKRQIRNRNLALIITREFDTLKSKKVPQSLEIGLFFCQIFIFII